MGFFAQRLLDYAVRRLQEASTWAGLVAATTGAIGWNVSPEMQAAVAQVGMALVGAILVFVHERHGANPNNAPLPPRGTAPVVTPAGDDVAAVVVHSPAVEAAAPIPPHVPPPSKPVVGQAAVPKPRIPGVSSGDSRWTGNVD